MIGPLHSGWSRVRRTTGRIVRRFLADSADYQLLACGAAPASLAGWSDAAVARRQHGAFRQILDRAKAGDVRADLRAACDAVAATGLTDAQLIDVGCASGYYAEAFRMLSPVRLRYVGADSSAAMIALARQKYGSDMFVVGDAQALPFTDGSCDILLSGTVLMHVGDMGAAVAESARVSRDWCIFHTVPVTPGDSVFVSKRAYGKRVAEWIFGRAELHDQLAKCGFDIVAEFESLDYTPPQDVVRDVKTVTYLCRKRLRV